MDSSLEHLDLGQWAWEFLRRNPAYLADYREFIALWQALETDYGAPPHRDFHRWKNDPRATRPAWDPALSTGAACVADEEDRQLIECWMGSKWGFYQFPQDPALPAWQLESPLNWRPPPGLRFDRPALSASEIRLTFDLALPLPAQLEAARTWLLSSQAALKRQGLAVPHSLTNQRTRWTELLHAWDSQSGDLLDEARAMVEGGYREILRLQGKPQAD
ncbi:hypothetical protein F8A87_02505 [Betaproteobacteria bacterium SCN2]|jgi:hypothetical protein|nr:hypothetical protein F8A87_02505 [Betaproteobacteria bacterium SCN2]